MVLVNSGVFLNVTKLTQRWTSRQVLDNLVQAVGLPVHDNSADGHKKRRNRSRVKYGFAGTLDPMATGILPVALGTATKLISQLPPLKIYRAVVQLGRTTDTDDATGQTLLNTPQLARGFTRQEIEQLIQEKLVGSPIWQIPPLYSAIHVRGERAYDLAREAKITLNDLPKRAVELYGARVRNFVDESEYGSYPEVEVDIVSGSGFYVRSFARDLGSLLGTGGVLKSLHRLHSASFDENDRDCREYDESDRVKILDSFKGVDYPFRFHPYLILDTYVDDISQLRDPSVLQRKLQECWLSKKKLRVSFNDIKYPELVPSDANMSINQLPKEASLILQGRGFQDSQTENDHQRIRVYVRFNSRNESNRKLEEYFDKLIDENLPDASKLEGAGIQLLKPTSILFCGLAKAANWDQQQEDVQLFREGCIVPEVWDPMRVGSLLSEVLRSKQHHIST